MMRKWFVLIWLLCPLPVLAQGFAAVALFDAENSTMQDARGGGIELRMALTQPVPYRVFLLDAPRRLVLSFDRVVFPPELPADFDRSRQGKVANFGQGWFGASQFVVELNQALALDSVELRRIHPTLATLNVKMRPSTDAEFAALAKDEDQILKLERDVGVAGPRRARPGLERPWRIALDPGHGGVDPGAKAGPIKEADLMLLFGFELRDTLRRAGYEVVLTREADEFVGLEGRMSRARAAGADIFLSLHADALAEGHAAGGSIYVLSDRASSAADQKLVDRHNSSDLIGGTDLVGQGDAMSLILLEMVRRETGPRSEKLAAALVNSFRSNDVLLHSKPLRFGDFAVLRSADMPSLLVELGFLSSPLDRRRLSSEAERAKIADAILAGLDVWTLEDAAQAPLRLK